MVGRKSNNKGYSLVETIIVIAIIGIVSAMALVSVSMIRTAKAKDASVVFNSEFAELVARAKAMNDKDGMCALRIYRDATDQKLYLQKGTVKQDGTKWKFKIADDNQNDYKGRVFARIVNMGYFAETSSGMPVYDTNYSDSLDAAFTTDNSIVANGSIGSFNDGDALPGMLIMVTKTGDVISGNGVYVFYKGNTDSMAYVLVRKNGTHDAR
jgi:prepilin-type N-terminal cleavage/methylation domain-containing protein